MRDDCILENSISLEMIQPHPVPPWPAVPLFCWTDVSLFLKTSISHPSMPVFNHRSLGIFSVAISRLNHTGLFYFTVFFISQSFELWLFWSLLFELIQFFFCCVTNQTPRLPVQLVKIIGVSVPSSVSWHPQLAWNYLQQRISVFHLPPFRLVMEMLRNPRLTLIQPSISTILCRSVLLVNDFITILYSSCISFL